MEEKIGAYYDIDSTLAAIVSYQLREVYIPTLSLTIPHAVLQATHDAEIGVRHDRPVRTFTLTPDKTGVYFLGLEEPGYYHENNPAFAQARAQARAAVRNLPVIPDALEALLTINQHLEAAGFFTVRPSETLADTKAWLTEQGFISQDGQPTPGSRVEICQNSADKIEKVLDDIRARNLKVGILFDDGAGDLLKAADGVATAGNQTLNHLIIGAFGYTEEKLMTIDGITKMTPSTKDQPTIFSHRSGIRVIPIPNWNKATVNHITGWLNSIQTS